MRPAQPSLWMLLLASVWLWALSVGAGTWADHFSQTTLGSDWQGDRDYFSIADGALRGNSASPLAPSPFNRLEVGKDWADYTVECRINVVEPNLRVCTKGALVLRDNDTDGYVFALHVATGTVEVYRLANHEMLLSKEAALELKRWYFVSAQLLGPAMKFFVDGELVGTVTDDRSLSGRVGVAVQDAEIALFDDFTVTGPSIAGNGLEVTVGQKVTITWPSTLTNYVLKAASQLAATSTWNVVTNPPSTNGEQLSVTLDAAQGTRFFILAPRNP